MTSATAPLPEIALYYHTHWDREWYEPFGVYGQRLVKVVDDVLVLLNNNQLSCFTLDGQTVVLSDYWQHRPETRDNIAALVEQGRLSVGPWFVMPDEFLVSGESLLRNLQLGMQQAKALGQKTKTGYLPDTFGHSADMPIILSHVGIKTAVVWRGVNPEQGAFVWCANNNDEGVLTLHLSSGYFMHHAHMESTLDDVKTGVNNFLKPIVAALPKGVNTALLPVGADHLGITHKVVQRMQQVQPDARVVTIDAYMNELLAQVHGGDVETITGELIDCTGQYLLPGVYSSRLYLKQANRKLEFRLSRQLEPLASLACLAGQPVSLSHNHLDQLWQTLLLNHPHDSICGCSVDAVHRDNEYRFEQVDIESTVLMQQLLWQCFNALPATKNNDDVLVANLATKPYTGVLPVELKTPFVSPAEAVPFNFKQLQQLSQSTPLDFRHHFDTTWLPLSENKILSQQCLMWVEDTAAMSLNRLSLKQLPQVPKAMQVKLKTLETGGFELSNDCIKLEVSASGELTATDLLTQQCYPISHQLVCQKDNGDSYNAAPVLGDVPDVAQVESIDVLSEGPLQVALAFNYRFLASGLVVKTTLVMQAHSPLLQFNTQFVNTLAQHKISAVFNSVAAVDSVIAEGHINVVEREYDPNYQLQAAMPVAKQKELKTNSGPIQRFVFWQQQGVITKGLTEYEVYQKHLSITLLRSFGLLSSDATGVRGSHAGPPLETPGGQCLNREIIAEYAWQPAEHALQLFDAADRYYGAVIAEHYPTQWKRYDDEPLVIPLTESAFAPLAQSLSQHHLVLMAFYAAADVDETYVLRLANPTLQPTAIVLPHGVTVLDAQGAVALNDLGERLIAPQNFATLLITFKV